MALRAVLMKTGLRPLNTTRPVNTAHPKTTVYSARPMPKAVNTARPNSTVDNVVWENQVNAVKASACWVWRLTKLNSHPQKEDQGYVDSGCSRHMTGNMSYLSDFKEFDGGYVTFGEESKDRKLLVKELLKLNIVPKECLTCLVAKATLDESMLWHRRLDRKLVEKKYSLFIWDNGTTFKNRVISEFCEEKCIKKEFSAARTLQQNCVAKRRNRTLINAARTMLADSKLLTIFWAEAVNTACYVQNRVLVVKPHNKTPYELFRGRTPALSFMRPFGCHVTILNTLDYLAKFDGKFDEGFFVGYSLNIKDFRVHTIRTRKVEENLHIRFLEDMPIIAGDGPTWLFDIDVLTKSMNFVPVVASTNSNDFVGTKESIGAGHASKDTGSSQNYILMPLWKDGSLFDSSSKNASNDEPQPKESRIDDQERPENSTQDVNIARPSINTETNMFSLGDNATLEGTHADIFGDETEVDMSNITTTYLVHSTPNTRIYKDHSLDHVIGDKLDRSYARGASALQVTTVLDLGGFTTWQKSHWIEAIRLFLAYASFKDFAVYQMDVKSAFLYGKIEEEVYVCQPLGFEDLEFPNRVYKVEKALYVLHQLLELWYETLSTYLLDNGFQRGQIDNTLFIKRFKSDILLVQVYVDDIIF
ncbi:putative ribonuclease H-like domain-containing protein [Tanacetum coccineum]|uniref:Ribonuclease H-like domain-containing protein n=1 Tax=Tanacetum coccineum TaxID=301880 RepID=A0ABQ5F1V4_9ASTR